MTTQVTREPGGNLPVSLTYNKFLSKHPGTEGSGKDKRPAALPGPNAGHRSHTSSTLSSLRDANRRFQIIHPQMNPKTAFRGARFQGEDTEPSAPAKEWADRRGHICGGRSVLSIHCTRGALLPCHRPGGPGTLGPWDRQSSEHIAKGRAMRPSGLDFVSYGRPLLPREPRSSFCSPGRVPGLSPKGRGRRSGHTLASCRESVAKQWLWDLESLFPQGPQNLSVSLTSWSEALPTVRAPQRDEGPEGKAQVSEATELGFKSHR